VKRAAIYARYSSEGQREASIEDQVRNCIKLIEDCGWQVAGTYSDRGISGATTLRAGYQRLLDDARNRLFDVLVVEGLDRLSRDPEATAALYKRMSFHGIAIVTRIDGEVNELHIGVKGAMNAIALKDLAMKTHRGIEGRVRQGKSGGGRAFGYRVVKQRDAKGEPVRGLREIEPMEAEVVQRIFREFAAGCSPRAIARGLNADTAGPDRTGLAGYNHPGTCDPQDGHPAQRSLRWTASLEQADLCAGSCYGQALGPGAQGRGEHCRRGARAAHRGPGPLGCGAEPAASDEVVGKRIQVARNRILEAQAAEAPLHRPYQVRELRRLHASRRQGLLGLRQGAQRGRMRQPSERQAQPDRRGRSGGTEDPPNGP
jgi:DNA invertase Pin-like site-specific DNA recombinase